MTIVGFFQVINYFYFILQNCKKKLDLLASLVKEKWRGVRLRVIEAYDLDRRPRHHHGVHSLHHEGRAVDIATEDRDKDKYPFLGKLAIEAGFDWVLYATKGYIHASVKTGNYQLLIFAEISLHVGFFVIISELCRPCNTL